jgi:hypothetical protein
VNEETHQRYRSRKFLLSASIQLFSTFALIGGFLEGADYAGISQANIVAYSFSNAAEYFKK